MYLSYSGAGDPRHGIRYQDILSPALVSRHFRGEVWSAPPARFIVAMGTKLRQMETSIDWLIGAEQPLVTLGRFRCLTGRTTLRHGNGWRCFTRPRAVRKPPAQCAERPPGPQRIDSHIHG